MNIKVRYGLVDRDDTEQDQDYGSLAEAQEAAGDQFAITRNVYQIEQGARTLISEPGDRATGPRRQIAKGRAMVGQQRAIREILEGQLNANPERIARALGEVLVNMPGEVEEKFMAALQERLMQGPIFEVTEEYQR